MMDGGLEDGRNSCCLQGVHADQATTMQCSLNANWKLLCQCCLKPAQNLPKPGARFQPHMDGRGVYRIQTISDPERAVTVQVLFGTRQP